MMDQILKYPRTAHLEGSKLQAGDEDVSQVPFSRIADLHVVYEEKLDGANCGFSFDSAGNIHAQSRGHELDMGARGGRERHFNLYKDWLNAQQDAFLDRLEDRYLVYGEWLYASHTVYYDALPHWFMEFDVFDHVDGVFLDTPRRHALLDGLPICHVPVLYEGRAQSPSHLAKLVVPSLYKTAGWRDSLRRAVDREGLDMERTVGKIEDSDLAEGIYGKVEENGEVVFRFKHVRHDFLQAVFDVNEHWLSRPIVPNGLAPGADIFAQPPQPQRIGR